MSGERPPPPAEFPKEAETGAICIACAGEGKLVEENATGSYRAVSCKWCRGTGAMTHEEVRAWKDRK